MLVIMHPPLGPQGQGVADRQRRRCISIFAGVFSLSFNTTHTTGYYRLLHFTSFYFDNFICILWHNFVLNKYLQVCNQFLADSHCVFSFSLCFQFLIVFLVSHCVFNFSLCFQFLTVISVSHCVFSFSLCFQFLTVFSVFM